MRPLMGHKKQGAEAREISGKGFMWSDCPYQRGSLASSYWALGYVEQEIFDDGLESEDRNNLWFIEQLQEQIESTTYRLLEDLPTPERIAESIGWSLEEWPGNCFAVASKALDSGVLDEFQSIHGPLILSYGIYYGEIHPTSIFAGKGMARHGWLESVDGYVADLTRYVFENAEPYMWVGPQDDYDLGAMRMRLQMRSAQSPLPPVFDENGIVGLHSFAPLSLDLIASILDDAGVQNRQSVTRQQFSWLMNEPLQTMGKHAPQLIEDMAGAGLGAFIPIDIRNWIEQVNAKSSLERNLAFSM